MKKIAVLVLSLVAAVTVSNAQVCALKSNALWLGIGGLNLGAEFSVAPQWTVDVAGSVVFFNPWKNVGGNGEGLYLNGWSGIVEGRYYLCRAFNGHHFGAFGQVARYGRGGNVPVIADNVYNNVKVAGLGVSYGYYFKLNTYWGIDTNVGIGMGLGTYEGRPNWKLMPVGRAEVALSYKF